MPGELPAPRRLSRRAEHLEAVPVRVEQALQRLGRHRPEHVLHGYHRDDLGVRGQADTGHDQLVAELALPRVQRADRQPVPVPRGQVRPGAPLVAEPVAGLFPLFVSQRSEECRGGPRHPFGRRGRGQPVPVVHDPIIRLRPPARSCEEFAAARGSLMSMSARYTSTRADTRNAFRAARFAACGSAPSLTLDMCWSASTRASSSFTFLRSPKLGRRVRPVASRCCTTHCRCPEA